jgi:MMP 1-O-methyltransferase
MLIYMMHAFQKWIASHNFATLLLAQIWKTIVAPSALAARYWTTPLALVFIDGGHSLEAALNDYRSWASHVMRGGFLVIHDVFPNPADGGRPPFEIWKLAQESGLFEALPLVKSLGVLKKL